MAVRLFYVDESYDQDKFCLSAVSIRHTHWKECFDAIKAHRKQLKSDYGIPISEEIHTRDFIRGRGSLATERVVTKWERSRIFLGLLSLIPKLPTMKLFNVCVSQVNIADAQMLAWDRLTNRIERTMLEFETSEQRKRDEWIAALRVARTSLTEEETSELFNRLKLFHARAIVIADEGRESEITKALRKMHVHNPIPSQFGHWHGRKTKNITTDRIIEDPVFKPSHRSHFLQLADCVAYALLKQETAPTSHVKKYKINEMFRVLNEVCYKKAAKNDPQGIVRK